MNQLQALQSLRQVPQNILEIEEVIISNISDQERTIMRRQKNFLLFK